MLLLRVILIASCRSSSFTKICFDFVVNISVNIGLLTYGSQGNKWFEMVALIFVIDLPLCSGLGIILKLCAADSLEQRQA